MKLLVFLRTTTELHEGRLNIWTLVRGRTSLRDFPLHLMAALKGWSSPHEYIVVLVFLMTLSRGSACEPPSSPECFKRNITETIVICEWRMNTTNPEVMVFLHIDKKTFPASKETCSLADEKIGIMYRAVDIWVEAREGNSSCMSTNRSVVLGHRVKFEAPQISRMSWSKNNLNLKWLGAGDPTSCEVLFRRPTEPWENRTTDPTIESSFYHLTVANLSKEAVYQLKVRHRYNSPEKHHVSLWSDWSPELTVPPELEQKPEVAITTKLLNGTRMVTLEWKAMPHAELYILNFHGCPCKKKKVHETRRLKHTFNVSLSVVNISVIANNSVGYSPPAIVQPEPVADLTICDKTLNEKFDKNTCREWYEQDGDSMSENVIRIIKKRRKKEEIGLKDYVRYLYFEHKCTANQTPQTVKMCLVYQKEGVPLSKPQKLTSLSETTTSADLSWEEIPSADQQGFLTHYTLCSVKVSSQDEVEECRNISASLTKHRLENLSPGGKYNIRLFGVTRAGMGPEAKVTFSTLQEDSMNVWWSLGLLIIFFSFAIVCACSRIQDKIFPNVPKPIIQDFNTYQPESEEFLEGKEQVDDLTLHHLPEVKPAPEDAEETTVLPREWDDDSELDDRADSMMLEGISDEFLGSTDEATRSSGEGEMYDPKQMDHEIAMLIYRNGLVFDIQTESP